MALDFTNTAGALFNRIGRIGKLAHISRGAQDDLKTAFDSLLAQYDSSVASPLQIVTNGTPAKRDAAVSGAAAFMASLTAEAQLTVLKMVLADSPSNAGTTQAALSEIRKQMLTQGKTLQQCLVTCVATADGDNAGNGVMVVSTKRGDGLVNELAFPETASVICSGDAQSGATGEGQESFVYTGEPRDSSPWSVDYPTGPGSSAFFTSVAASEDGSEDSVSGNLLVNSDFENFTTNLPDYWDTLVGVAGTDFLLSTDKYSGTNCLKIVGGSTNTNIYQQFDSVDGTEAVLRPSQSYAVNFFAKMDANPSTGILTIELTDGNNVVTQDDQGVANSFTVDLTTIGTSYVAKNGVFRTPRDVPSVCRLSIRISTDIQSTKNLLIDHMALTPLSSTYPGGPGGAIFGGAIPFVVGDKFELVSTNDFGGATRTATMHWLLERLFGIRAMGILFPSSATPDVADTLITS